MPGCDGLGDAMRWDDLRDLIDQVTHPHTHRKHALSSIFCVCSYHM